MRSGQVDLHQEITAFARGSVAVCLIGGEQHGGSGRNFVRLVVDSQEQHSRKHGDDLPHSGWMWLAGVRLAAGEFPGPVLHRRHTRHRQEQTGHPTVRTLPEGREIRMGEHSDWTRVSLREEHGDRRLQGIRDANERAKGGVGVTIFQGNQGALAHTRARAKLVERESQGLPARLYRVSQRNCAILYHREAILAVIIMR